MDSPFPTVLPASHATRASADATAPVLAALFVGLAMLGSMRAPMTLTLAIVMVAAGPHNWMELRYFLTHMPAHWGPQRAWFTTALGGVAALSAATWGMQWIGVHLEDDGRFWQTAAAAWTACLLLWIGLLAYMRGHRWTLPAALGGSAVAWMVPLPWDLALVYLHPLMALAYLERDLRHRPPWRSAYRLFLAALPLLLAVVWCGTADTMSPPDDVMRDRVAGLAGAWLLPNVSPQRLAALYVFLQLLHYGAWLVALPLLRLREAPWRLRQVPLRRRFPVAVAAFTGLGAVVVGALWYGFWRDPVATWDLYFRLAIVHVLVEFPFLIRKIPA